MKTTFLALGIIFFLNSCSQVEEVHFTVYTEAYSYIDCPVEISYKSIWKNSAGFNPAIMSLYEIREDRETEVAFQYKAGRIFFIMEGKSDPGSNRHFVLKDRSSSYAPSGVKFTDSDGKLSYSPGKKGEVVYHRKESYPPEGTDTIYKRSAFLHPVTTPAGEVLTRINPPDHLHHYGLWNPWTKTHIKGREIDYWNLGKGQGTVRYMSTEDAGGGPLFGFFDVNHQAIDLAYEKGERVSMAEKWKVRVWNVNMEGNRYILDLQTEFTNILKDTILFDAYRYGGGLGYRAPEKWKADNCTVLSSEGLTRDEADGTKARWILIEGEAATEKERAGILFLSHPDNREHPEPVRVWPTSSSGGELMFDYCPIRYKEWIIEPGKSYSLNYRMIVFDGMISPDEAEMYWNGFAHPPLVSLK